MKNFFALIVCLTLISGSWCSHAQEVTYTKYEKFDYHTDAYSVAGMSGGNLFTYIRNNDGSRLDVYNDSLNKVATVILDFFPSRIYQVRFITYPDKIIALYQALESNKVVQYAALLDENGLLKGKPLELGSIRTGIFGATRNYFSSAYSDNKKNIIIYTATDKENEIVVDCKWLNEECVVTNTSKVTFTAENRAEHKEVNVANDGTVYMAAYTPVGSEDYADQYWILKLQPGATAFEAKELALGEKFAAGGYTKVDNVNNVVYFGGFYSNNKNGNFDGIIYAAYSNAEDKYTISKFIPFDGQLVAASPTSRRGGNFDNYVVKQLIAKNDGGFVMISEMTYITTRSTFTPGFGYYSFYTPYMNSSVREYHYNDIMVLSYDKNGTREWNSFVHKRQYSQEDEGVFSSYALLNTGGTLAFLYNDFDVRHSRIQLSTVSPEGGKTETHGLAAEGNDYPDWLPRSSRQVSGRSLVIPCVKKKQICFARVSF